MSIPNHPRIICHNEGDPAYLMTCKKEFATSLVKWLMEKGIPASQSGVETTEEMRMGPQLEEYVISQIEIDPPTDYQTVKVAVDAWSAETQQLESARMGDLQC